MQCTISQRILAGMMLFGTLWTWRGMSCSRSLLPVPGGKNSKTVGSYFPWLQLLFPVKSIVQSFFKSEEELSKSVCYFHTWSPVKLSSVSNLALLTRADKFSSKTCSELTVLFWGPHLGQARLWPHPFSMDSARIVSNFYRTCVSRLSCSLTVSGVLLFKHFVPTVSQILLGAWNLEQSNIVQIPIYKNTYAENAMQL